MDKKFLGLSLLLIITFVLFATIVFLSGSVNIFSRASTNTQPSLSNSLIFAWPLEIVADGKTSSEITVFIRNSEGKGVTGQQVTIENSLGTIPPGTRTTSDDGKVVFQITSTEIGVAQIEALVNNRKLQRTISVKFK